MTKDEQIKKLVRAAKIAMNELVLASPLTPADKAWHALHQAVKSTKKKGKTS